MNLLLNKTALFEHYVP